MQTKLKIKATKTMASILNKNSKYNITCLKLKEQNYKYLLEEN